MARPNPRILHLAPLLVAAALVACAAPRGAGATPGSDGDGGSRSFEPIPAETTPPPEGSVPHELLDRMVADAARRASVDHSAIEVETAEAVTWSDGSLGCPQPGQVYTQALVPGYRVVLRAGTETLEYHASQRNFIHCASPAPASGNE